MSIKLLGAALLAAVLLSGVALLKGPLTPSFALSPSEQQIVPLPPLRLELNGHEPGDGAGAPAAAQGDAARLLGLMNGADAVVAGTVIAETHALDGGASVTTLEVHDWLKGGTSHNIRVVQSAGDGGSLLRSGESYLLLLRADPALAPDTYRIAGQASEGQFTQRDGGWVNDDPRLTTALQFWSQKQPAALAKKLAA